MVRTVHLIRVIVLLAAAVVMVGCRAQAEQAVAAAAFGEEVKLRSNPSVVRNLEVDEYFDEMAREVLYAARHLHREAGGRPDEGAIDCFDEFDVYVVHSPQLNAWVYGDDFACVTTNLILQADHPEEVVAVLCHEFAHLKHEHIIEAKEREIAHHACADAISFAGRIADVGARMGYFSLPMQVSGLADQLGNMHRASFNPAKPSDEFEADAYAVKLYASMGLDLVKVDDFLERIIVMYGEQQSRHRVHTDKRLRKIQTMLRKVKPAADQRELDPEAFASVQEELRQVLVARRDRDKLVTFETAQRRERRRPAYATTCAPPDLDERRLNAALVEVMSKPIGSAGE